MTSEEYADGELGPAPAKGNILLVANWESGVGYAWWLMENFWVAIADRYAATGSRAFLVYPVLNGLPKSVADAPIEVSERTFDGLGFREMIKVLLWVRGKRIRNVYLTDRPFLHPLYLLLRLVGVRKIVIHDHTPGDREPCTGARRWAKRALNELPWIRADYFVGATEFIRERLVRNAVLPARRCGFATNGIVPISESESTGDVRHTFGYPDDAIVVVTTGRATQYKGIDLIIELAHELVHGRGRDQLRFLFCGDGPDLESFRELVRVRSLHDNFTFAGRRSDVRAMLASCDIGIQGSKGEVGYSLSILEYMSAGLATLVPDRPSTALATEHMVNGLVYPPEDVTRAASYVERLIDDPELRRRLGERAREEVARRFRLDQTNLQLLTHLDREFV